MFVRQGFLPRVLQLQALIPGSFRNHFNTASLNTTMNPDVNRILSFWFDGPDVTQKWFFPEPGFDKEVQDAFGSLMKQARTTQLDTWIEEPKASLALIILLDQFPRNVWRNTPDAFNSDAKALDIASRSIIKGFDKEVTIWQQLFFYLPFMHNESVVGQAAAMSLLEGALIRADPESEEANFISKSLGFAKDHAKSICKFGRFPRRNSALGRPTTEVEEEYLKEFPNGF